MKWFIKRKNEFQLIKNHLNISKHITKLYNETNFINNLGKTFKQNVYKQKHNIIYMLVNPKSPEMETELNVVILDDEIRDTKQWLEKWLINNIRIVCNILHKEELYDFVSFEINKIDDSEIWSVKLFPVTLPDYLELKKKIFNTILWGGIILLSISLIIAITQITTIT